VRKLWVVVLFFITGTLMANYTAKNYINDVSTGKITACKWVQLAVKRHVNDLKKQNTKNFPYHFDSSYAERCIDFIEQLKHTKGEFANSAKHESINIKLEPWQQFIIWVIEGWRNEKGLRRFTRAYIEVARKNGKTTLASALANFHFFADKPREIGAEIYFAATKQQQAALAWDEADRQIKKHPLLKELAQTYHSNKRIVIPSTAAVMRPLGRDSKTEDGLNPSFAVIDEYHAHPDAGIIDVIESGMGAREQPLLIIITTAGNNFNSPCIEEHEHLKKMLEGSIPFIDNFFGIIYTLDEGDDWKNKKVWIKANPNLGVSVDIKRLEEQINLAASSTVKITNVKTKRLNIWCKSIMGWISYEDWNKCNAPYDENDVIGRECYGAFDLSGTQDLSAVSLTFTPQEKDEPYKHIYRFYIPEDLIQEKEDLDKVPYRAWIQEGFVIATPGNVIDYDWIEADIMQDAEKYRVKEFAYDPYHAQQIVNHLTNAGMKMVPIQQGYRLISPMCDNFEKKVLSKQMSHNDNPVMKWMISCVEMKSDRQNNVMPMKPRRDSHGKRIDGVVANIMSLGRASLHVNDSNSVYDKRGVIFI
jgi:phage terminase large subunit-like protein